MSRKLSFAVGAVALAFVLPFASAHHSFAVYDFDTEIEFVGTIDTLNFKNPHISLTVRVTNEDGQEEIFAALDNWYCRLSHINRLRKVINRLRR